MEKTTEFEMKKNAACIDTGERLIKIVAGIINNEKADLEADTDFERILRLAHAHRITGFVAYGVKNYDLKEETLKKYEAELFKTAARYTAQEREILGLSKAFSEEKIEHCFLKGLKVSKYYDIPESRFMLDIDIYINPEKFESALAVMRKSGYEALCTDDKDCSLSKKPFLNVDLHKELKYDFDLDYEFYKNVYDRLLDVPDSYEKTMSKEELFVYLLSHTAHHFATAGTGIKSVIDHYYLVKNLVPECDKAVLENMLSESGLKGFNEKLTKLTSVWFKNGETDETIEKMSEYIILSGAYGTDINYFVNGVLRMGEGNKKKNYYLSRLFPEYEFMCYRYEILKKHKALLPMFWGIRIASTVFSAKRIKNEAQGIKNVNETDASNQVEFLKSVGL